MKKTLDATIFILTVFVACSIIAHLSLEAVDQLIDYRQTQQRIYQP